MRGLSVMIKPCRFSTRESGRAAAEEEEMASMEVEEPD
mgnify:CR=1 FL=1